MANDDRPSQEQPESGQEHALVPIYSPLATVREGIRAFRRGGMILYTVRGEPEEVEELIRELRGRGVEEVVALVSHRVVPDEESEPDADIEVVSGSDE